MRINFKKTKAMVTLGQNDLEVVDEVRILGLIIRSDLKWVSNTDSMVSKANKRIWIVRRLKYDS